MESTLKRMMNYHFWAMDKLFRHLAQLPFASPICVKLMQHMVNAESIWTSRITGEKPSVGVWEERPLAECHALHLQTLNKLAQMIDETCDLEKEISYLNSQGDSFVNSAHDILIHLFNHATYHRAQIAKELRMLGLEPVNTDYINYMRIGI